MKPIKFKHSNTEFTSKDPNVEPLPAFKDSAGSVVTCWELEPGDFAQIAKTKRIWMYVVTGNQPVHPCSLHAFIPLLGPNGENLDDEK